MRTVRLFAGAAVALVWAVLVLLDVGGGSPAIQALRLATIAGGLALSACESVRNGRERKRKHDR